MENNIILPDERLDIINEDLRLIQKKDGLTFGTDAYLLAAFLKKYRRCADLGAGTGVASFLCLTKNKAEHFYGVELQKPFAELCQRNAELNGLSNRFSVINKDIREITEKDTEGQLDAVISNPPYMKADSGFSNVSDAMNTARREMNGTILDFCFAASKILKFGGVFLTVYRPDRISDLICSLKETGFELKKIVTVYPNTKSKPCLILTESKKGASSGTVHSRPLIIYKDDSGEYTEDMQKVYDTCSLSHLF